jgi:Rrf2 family protein
MKLTRASSYALHAVAFMAGQKKEQITASHLIAEKKGIPERFLLKVLKPLVSSQILLSVKGPHGGYRLARNAQDISMLEIIESVDGPIRGSAPLNRNEQTTSTFNKKLDVICGQAADQVRKVLGKTKISDLA